MSVQLPEPAAWPKLLKESCKRLMTRTWVKVWKQDEVWSLDAHGQVQNPWGSDQKFSFPGPVSVLHRQSLGRGGVPSG